MNSGICSQISSSCNCPIIRQYFVFKTVLVCFWINCVPYREIILYDSYSRRTSFVENKDVKVSAINMQSFFSLTCDQVFFFFFGENAKVGGRGKRIKRTRLFPFVSQTKGKEGLLIAGYVFFRKQFACHVWLEENGPLSRCGRMVQKEQKYIYPAGWQMTQWDLGKKRTAFWMM